MFQPENILINKVSSWSKDFYSSNTQKVVLSVNWNESKKEIIASNSLEWLIWTRRLPIEVQFNDEALNVAAASLSNILTW